MSHHDELHSPSETTSLQLKSEYEQFEKLQIKKINNRRIPEMSPFMMEASPYDMRPPVCAMNKSF